MRSFLLMAAAAASLFSSGCVMRLRDRPVARYHAVGPRPVYVAPPPHRYGHRLYRHRDDRGYHYDYR